MIDENNCASKTGATISAVRVTKEQIEQGYTICPCGEFAHVTDHRILRGLPPGCRGELCPDCGLYMLPVEYLPKCTGDA